MELLSSVKYNIKDPELYCVVLWLWNCVADVYAGLLFIEAYKSRRPVKGDTKQITRDKKFTMRLIKNYYITKLYYI